MDDAIPPSAERASRPMSRETELELLDELLGLRRAGSAYLDEAVTRSETARYTDPERFARERARALRGRPVVAAASAELAEDGAFRARSLLGTPLILTRDRAGGVNAFVNVCRHRGSRLVSAEGGCRHRFTCPYHAWTWDNQGRLIAVPHREQGFPDLDASRYGLKRLACAEAHGLVFVTLDADAAALADPKAALDAHLADLAPDLAWMDLAAHDVFAVDERVWSVNWKIVIEGGLEAYHFRVAHARTIAGMFHDNLSTYQCFGPHLRSVLAKRSVDELAERPRSDWSLRAHANLLYALFPNTALLVQPDHVALIQFEAEAVDRTRIRLSTLIPKPDGPLEPSAQTHWERNHALTVETLNEDFAIGEAIQSGFQHGVNEAVTFGRYEGALDAFNARVDAACA